MQAQAPLKSVQLKVVTQVTGGLGVALDMKIVSLAPVGVGTAQR